MICKVGAAFVALPIADGALLDAWCRTGLMDGEAVTAGVMAAALTAEGHPVGSTTVKDHRARRCVCFRSSREQL